MGKKKEAKLAARGGRRRWSGLRDTEEVGERDEKSRCRVDLEMNNDRGMDEISGVRSTSRYIQQGASISRLNP